MYLYQPCLLALSLCVWAFGERGRNRWFRILFPLLILAVSEGELSFSRLWIYPASLLLVLYLLRKPHTVAWEEVLTASILGGAFAWKAADAWPLLRVLPLLCALLMLAPIFLLCRGREDRLLSCALGGILFELFFCIKEQLLFSYSVIRLGSRDSLSLSTAAICLHGFIEQAKHLFVNRYKRSIPVSN